MFQGRETMGVGDAGIEECNINIHHDGVEGERKDGHKEMIGIFNV